MGKKSFVFKAHGETPDSMNIKTMDINCNAHFWVKKIFVFKAHGETPDSMNIKTMDINCNAHFWVKKIFVFKAHGEADVRGDLMRIRVRGKGNTRKR